MQSRMHLNLRFNKTRCELTFGKSNTCHQYLSIFKTLKYEIQAFQPVSRQQQWLPLQIPLFQSDVSSCTPFHFIVCHILHAKSNPAC